MSKTSSVACMLSHIRCWDWLAQHPEFSFALIFMGHIIFIFLVWSVEDDVCFERDFRVMWDTVAVPCLFGDGASPALLDCLVMGYFKEESPVVHHLSSTEDEKTLYNFLTVDSFFGAHAYAVFQQERFVFYSRKPSC